MTETRWEDLPETLAQWTMEYTGPGQSGKVLNIGLLNTFDLDAINQGDCDNFYDTWASNIMPSVSNSVSLISCTLKNSVSEFVHAESTPGSAPSAMDPLNNAYLIKKLVSPVEGIRPGHIYVPGVPEGAVGNDGIIDSSVVSTFQTDLNDFESDLAGHDLFVVVGHTRPSLDITPVTGFVAMNKISNQRRRIRR